MTANDVRPGAAATLALERRFPVLAGRLPRRALAALPTAVHRLPALERDAGLGELWIKRDDRTGALYGGNKVRKLEWLLADALQRGHRSILTTGALGSNHALATTIYARAVGLRTHVVLVPQPVTPHVRHTLLLDHAFGARLHFAPSVAAAARTVVALMARGVLGGDRLYRIPTGGSSVLGTLGYVNAALELAEQVAAGELPVPAAVVVPVGSGGTTAGLLAGLKLAGLPTRVIGIQVTDILPSSPRQLIRLARHALDALRRLGAELPRLDLGAEDILVRSDWLGPGYGAATAAAEAARERLAADEGLTVDTTYGAKALAGALALGRTAPWRDRPLLFWHTFSSSDPAAGLAALPDWRQLPAPLHRFFAPDA